MGKKIEMHKGDKYGLLTVIKQSDDPDYINRKHIYWECLCDCGKIINIDGTNLRNGHTKSCPDCARKAAGLKRRIDVIGKTYGLLTVDSVEYGVTTTGNKKRTFCNCTCVCGNTVRTTLDQLRSPGLHSCGCGRKISADRLSREVIGEKFYRLTVIKEYKECTPREVLCECECGNKIRIKKTEVMSGHTKSCGCLHKEVTSETNSKDWTGQISEFGVEFICRDYKNDHGTWMWKCRCPCCGNIFTALPAQVTSGNTSSCGCRTKSKGEHLIESILKDNNIVYIPQYTISDCKYKNVLRFDFGIFTDYETLKLIEYDGKQHFYPIDFFGGKEEFERNKIRDAVKTDYCQKHNIELLRIPYTCNTEEIRKMIMDII